jgi:hypothetical protein
LKVVERFVIERIVQNSVNKETHHSIAVRVLQKSLGAALPYVIVAICHLGIMSIQEDRNSKYSGSTQMVCFQGSSPIT